MLIFGKSVRNTGKPDGVSRRNLEVMIVRTGTIPVQFDFGFVAVTCIGFLQRLAVQKQPRNPTENGAF